jgi:segregation and condensation protein A
MSGGTESSFSVGYRVTLELFQGPLDLLLYLVRRDELDIGRLPISKITSQFHDFLSILEQIDLDLVGDFVLMASTLMEIKSRDVLPNPEQEAATAEDAGPIDNGDPKADLVHKLLEYKRFKDAAHALDVRAQEWQERYPRLSDERPRAGKDHAADRIKEVELWDLVSALGRILKRKDVEDERTVKYDETPIHVYVEQIGSLVRAKGEVRFSSLFEGEPIRSRVVGMFLAVLELLRHHGFRAIQEADFADITILPPESEAEAG